MMDDMTTNRWTGNGSFYKQGRLAGFVSRQAAGCVSYVIPTNGGQERLNGGAGLSYGAARRLVELYWAKSGKDKQKTI